MGEMRIGTRVRVWNIKWRVEVDEGLEDFRPTATEFTVDEQLYSFYQEESSYSGATVKSTVSWYLGDRYRGEVMELEFRLLGSESMIGVKALTLGEVDRCYGGPEEGGWWYDAFSPEYVFYVRADRYERLRGLVTRLCEQRNEGRRDLSSVRGEPHATWRSGVVGATGRQRYS